MHVHSWTQSIKWETQTWGKQLFLAFQCMQNGLLVFNPE